MRAPTDIHDRILELLAVEPRRTYQSIADEVGRSTTLVGNIARRGGKLRRPHRGEITNAHRLYREMFADCKLSIAEIAHRAGVSGTAVSAARKGTGGHNIHFVETIAEVCGYRVVLEKIEGDA